MHKLEQTTFKFIERPTDKYTARSVPSPLYKALMETAVNKKAIILSLNGISIYTMQAALRSWCARHGYEFHYRANSNKEFIAAWTDKQDKKKKK